MQKKIAVVVKESEYMEAVSNINLMFEKISIPDGDAFDCDDAALQGNYVLLLHASNFDDKTVGKNSKWNVKFCNDIKKNMKINVKGRGIRTKHFGSVGDYYGYGTIGKYEKVGMNSVSEFAGNNLKTDKVIHLNHVLKNDLNYIMKRNETDLPYSVFSGFSTMMAMVTWIKRNKRNCETLYDMFDRNGNFTNMSFLSNWICHKAETKVFH